MMKTKKTKMLLELLAQNHSEKPADESDKKTESEDQTSIHSREKEKTEEEKKSKKSHLTEMMKIWNPRILMTLMYKKIHQEEETISYVSNL